MFGNATMIAMVYVHAIRSEKIDDSEIDSKTKPQNIILYINVLAYSFL